MRAIAHGWTPSRTKNPPSRAVAQEFVDADRKYSGGFAENRYWVGGLAAMDKVNAGFQGSLDNPFREFEEGGEVMQRGGRARRKIGRVMPLDGGDQYTSTTYKPRPIVTAPTSRGRIGGVAGQPTRYAPPATVAPTTTSSGPRITAGARSGRRGTGRRGRGGRRNGGGGDGRPGGGRVGGSGTTPRTIIPTNPASYVGGAAGASGGESPYREELRQHQAKIAATLGSARGGHVTGYAEGGTTRADNPFDPVKQKYQWRSWERKYGRDPDVAEPEAAPPPEPEAVAEEEDGGIAQWLRATFTPDPETAIGSGEARGTTEEQLEEMEQAYGGRVRYQAGGLATAAPGRILPPAGGVPPWIEPVGSGPGFMEPEQGYQFGGIAARMGPAMRMARQMRGRQQGGGGQYRGVPPQQGRIQQGAQPGGGGWRGAIERGRQQRGAAPGLRGLVGAGGGRPGGLAAMMRQAQQQQGAAQPGGGGQQGFMSRLRQMVAQQRAQQPGGGGVGNTGPILSPYEQAESRMRGPGGGPEGGPGGGVMGRIPMDMQPGPFNRTPSGEIDLGGGRTPEWGPGMPGRVQAGGGMYSDPRHPAYSPPGSGGSFDMSGRYTPPTQGPLAGHDPTGGKRFGRRIAPPPGKGPGGSGPIYGGPGESGPMIPGGPRVPPNMQGYLQKQRMMNRPPSNVGGGGNRVGMADQQGAMARAMQRGTGRAPPSRRFGRGRAGRGRGFQQQ